MSIAVNNVGIIERGACRAAIVCTRDNRFMIEHMGSIAGIKERNREVDPPGSFPERLVEKAIERIIRRGPSGRVQMGNWR